MVASRCASAWPMLGVADDFGGALLAEGLDVAEVVGDAVDDDQVAADADLGEVHGGVLRDLLGDLLALLDDLLDAQGADDLAQLAFEDVVNLRAGSRRCRSRGNARWPRRAVPARCEILTLPTASTVMSTPSTLGVFSILSGIWIRFSEMVRYSSSSGMMKVAPPVTMR